MATEPGYGRQLHAAGRKARSGDRRSLADDQGFFAVGEADRAADGLTAEILVPEHEPLAFAVVPVERLSEIGTCHQVRKSGSGILGHGRKDRSNRRKVGGIWRQVLHLLSPCSEPLWAASLQEDWHCG